MQRNCELCGKWSACHRHHLIGGTANRKNAERYNLTMYLCPECHRKAHEDPDVAAFKTMFDALQGQIAKIKELLKKIGTEDPATAEKLGRALAAVAAQLTEG